MRDLAKARRSLGISAAAIASGLALAASASQLGGGILLLVGWLFMVAALHAFGRAGGATG